MKNRYIFFKKIFKNYVILIDKKGKLVTYNNDKYLKKYLSKGINYLIIDKNNRIKKYSFYQNQYRKYLYKMLLDKIINQYISKF